jgi:hypothetical protein
MHNKRIFNLLSRVIDGELKVPLEQIKTFLLPTNIAETQLSAIMKKLTIQNVWAVDQAVRILRLESLSLIDQRNSGRCHKILNVFHH